MLRDEVIVESPHRPGELARMFTTLSRARVEVLGVSAQARLADMRMRKQVRFLLDDPVAGAAALKHASYGVKVKPAIVLAIDHPVLHVESAMERLAGSGLNIDGLYYARDPDSDAPCLVLATESADKAIELLGLARGGRRPGSGAALSA